MQELSAQVPREEVEEEEEEKERPIEMRTLNSKMNDVWWFYMYVDEMNVRPCRTLMQLAARTRCH